MARPSNAARATAFHVGVFGTIGVLINAGSNRCGALASFGNLMRSIGESPDREPSRTDRPGQAALLASETTQTEPAYRTRKPQPEAYKALCHYRCRPARHRRSDRGRRCAAAEKVQLTRPAPRTPPDRAGPYQPAVTITGEPAANARHRNSIFPALYIPHSVTHRRTTSGMATRGSRRLAR